jgi:hypothetical protein
MLEISFAYSPASPARRVLRHPAVSVATAVLNPGTNPDGPL